MRNFLSTVDLTNRCFDYLYSNSLHSIASIRSHIRQLPVNPDPETSHQKKNQELIVFCQLMCNNVRLGGRKAATNSLLDTCRLDSELDDYRRERTCRRRPRILVSAAIALSLDYDE